MKYVFFGSPRFAAIVLERLIQGNHPPLAVIASPDRPTGRSQELTPPITKSVCEKYSIPIHQPEKLNASEIAEVSAGADFFVVAAYGKIIPLSIIQLPRLGTLGIHPSPLPHLRGASPIQSTILTGSDKAGVSIYQMDAQIDHGPVLKTSFLKDYKPDQKDYASLEKDLAELGGQLFLEVVPDYLEGILKPIPQIEEDATFTTKFKTADAEITEMDLRESLTGKNIDTARKTLRKILAFREEPGAWTILKEPISLKDRTLPASLRIKLLGGQIEGNVLEITHYQVEGKKIQIIS